MPRRSDAAGKLFDINENKNRLISAASSDEVLVAQARAQDFHQVQRVVVCLRIQESRTKNHRLRCSERDLLLVFQFQLPYFKAVIFRREDDRSLNAADALCQPLNLSACILKKFTDINELIVA